MKILVPVIAALLAPSTVLAAAAPADTIAESRRLAEAHRYVEALDLLRIAEKAEPGNGELILAEAQVLSWKGDFTAAGRRLDALGPAAQADPDVQLLRGNLAYYRGDFDQAHATYSRILTAHPDYGDARDGLYRVDQARAAEDARPHWQFDLGGDASQFSRRPQQGWSQQFVQVTHSGRTTTTHAALIRYDQFGVSDLEAELGADRRLGDRLTGYVTVAATSNARFRPDYRLAAGGAWRVTKAGRTPVWLSLDARHDAYATATVRSLKLGLRVEPAEGWAVSGHAVTVFQRGLKDQTGYDLRLDGRLSQRLGFYAGFADAPETVAAETIATRSVFAGVAWQVTPQTTLRAGFARDDRQNSYIRRAVNVSISHRF